MEGRQEAGWCLRVVFLLCCQVGLACPPLCNCSLDQRGSRQLYCGAGGLRGVAPVDGIDPATEVLRITAPAGKENQLTIGPIFQGLVCLREVHLTRSNVPAIGKHTFWGVPSLRLLNLTDNNITQVMDNNFRGLVHLEELHLDRNRIESMSSGTFQYLTELRVLSLTQNQLVTLAPRLFLKLGQLQVLRLSHNRLESLDPHVFKDVQELRRLECRNCGLRTMNPHMYSLLPNLSHLDLGDNQFKYLDREAFLDLRNLVSLDLDGNHFPVVMDGTFQSQAKLERLNLARSEIAKVTRYAFANLTALADLDLSYNKLEGIEPETFATAGQTLRRLVVSGNNIRPEDFTYVLQRTRRVRSLGLADLDMRDGIPHALLGAVNGLKHLNISGTGLSRFPVELLYPVASLSSLDLSRNELHSLDERAMARLAYVHKVYLDDNPWLCDLCHAGSMLDAGWAVTAVCTAPPRLLGRSIASLTPQELAGCDAILDVKSGSIFSWPQLRQLTAVLSFAAATFTAVLVLVLAVGLVWARRHNAVYHTQRGVKSEKAKSKRRSKSTVAVIDDLAKTFELTPLNINGKA